jgi:hypothetical protein
MVGNAATSGEVLELNPSNPSLPLAALLVQSNATLQLDEPVTVNALSILETASDLTNSVPEGTYTPAQLSALGYGGNFRGSGSITVLSSAVPTANVLTSGENPSGFNDAIAFTDTVSPASAPGSVQFLTNGVLFDTETLVAGSATSASLSNLPRGLNTITAIYVGSGGYLSSTNQITQTVTNHPPTAQNNTYARNGLNGWQIALSDLLTNAADIDGDTLTLTSAGPSTNGVTLVVSGGFLMYANTNLVDDQFDYSVADGYGGTATGVITLDLGTPAGLAGQVASFTVTGGVASLSFAGIPGYQYNIQRSTDILDPNGWTTIWTTNAPASGVFQFQDNSAPPPSAFYRLMWNGNE